MAIRNPLCRLSAALLLGLSLATGMGAALADDLDIYIDPTPLPVQAPLTALALDLNLTGARGVTCGNVLLSTETDCISLRAKISARDLITYLGVAPSVLGTINPDTLLSELDSSTRLLLSGALGSVQGLALGAPETYLIALQQLLTSLTDSRVSILLNHANRGPATGQTINACAFADQSSLPGARQDTLACSNGAYLFAGLVNLADPLQLVALLNRVRQALFGDSVIVNSDGSTTSVAVRNPNVTVPRAFAADHPYQTKEIYAELAKYLRGDPIFNGHLGIFDYRDQNAANNLDASFPLLAWDRNIETANNKNYKSGLSAFPLACNINLVHVQLTNAQGQNDSDSDLKTLFPDADADGNRTLTLPELVASAEADGFVFGTDDRRRIRSRFVVQENLFTAGDLSDLDRINSTVNSRTGALGGTVSSYSDVLGLLGRGKSIAGSLIEPLSVDASLTSLTIAASRASVTGILQSAYLPVFRADRQQRPAWPGNLKRLRLRARPTPDQALFDVVDARDNAGAPAVSALTGEGRIRSTALTFWTDATQLGTTQGIANTSDGGVTDLGGAGQRIPGYRLNGGGNPGRSNGAAARNIFYDSNGATGNPLCVGLSACALNPDDSAVRAELQAATGATAVTLPDPNCATNCSTAQTQRDAICNASTTFTEVCNTENTQCLSGCSGTSYTNTCNSEQATCNAACPTALGLARTNCLAQCTATRALCPGQKLLACNGGCSTALLLCPTTKRLACLADSAAQYTSCRLACEITRSADTVTRELLLHARGFDVGTRASPAGDGPANSRTNSGIVGRPWLLGAVLHSRPLAINYGRINGATSPEVVRVVYGSADGMLHMVNDDTGAEIWGFMPQQVMGSLATLRDNQTGSALPYGVDGSPLVILRDRGTTGANSPADGVISSDNPNDRALVIFGLRRGGAGYYALDVKDPNRPRLAWRLTSQGLQRAGQTAVEPGTAALFAPMALAFSTPQVARIRVDLDENLASTDDQTLRTALIFGGGYNGGRNAAGSKIGKDLNNSRAVAPISKVGVNDGNASGERGNALFMLDVTDTDSPRLLWRAVRSTTGAASYSTSTRSYAHPLLEDSIPSDVTVVDSDNDGLSDRLYVGDTGGRLWRADFAGLRASLWTMTPVASVGRHNSGADDLANDRRIFFAPDYVPLRNQLNNQGSDVVLFGTGDREDITNLSTQNWFYGFRDRDLVSGKAADEIALIEGDIAARQSTFRDFSSTALVDVTTLDQGYRFRYTRSGEKHFSAPVTLGGTATFTSYVPPDPSVPEARICTPSEGASRLYSINVRDSSFRVVNSTKSAGRDIPLATGLPGEINVLGGTSQAAGGLVYQGDPKDTYRASWRERIGETQK